MLFELISYGSEAEQNCVIISGGILEKGTRRANPKGFRGGHDGGFQLASGHGQQSAAGRGLPSRLRPGAQVRFVYRK